MNIKPITCIVFALSLSSCAWWQENGRNQVRTVLDVARLACALYAEDVGLSVKDICQTEEQLRPFINSILAGQASAAAARTAAAAAGSAPECPSGTPVVAPVSPPAASAVPVPPPAESAAVAPVAPASSAAQPVK